jgi:hypothetical protein
MVVRTIAGLMVALALNAVLFVPSLCRGGASACEIGAVCKDQTEVCTSVVGLRTDGPRALDALPVAAVGGLALGALWGATRGRWLGR